MCFSKNSTPGSAADAPPAARPNHTNEKRTRMRTCRGIESVRGWEFGRQRRAAIRVHGGETTSNRSGAAGGLLPAADDPVVQLLLLRLGELRGLARRHLA